MSTHNDLHVKLQNIYQSSTVPEEPSRLSRKRPNSSYESPEKRQRIHDNGPLVTPEFAAIATKAASQNGASWTASADHTNSNVEDWLYAEHVASTETSASYDPYLSMRLLSLPILESLSVQILSTLCHGSYSVTVNGIGDQHSEFFQAYTTLTSLFEQTKKIYSSDAIFLSTTELHIVDIAQQKLIHLTNLATYVSSAFGGGLGLGDLGDHFLSTFVPGDTPLRPLISDLLLNMRTQMYLSSVSQDEQEDTKEDLLERYFSLTELRHILQARHPSEPLTDEEERFLGESVVRAKHLMSSANDAESIQLLLNEYPWEDFLKNLRACVAEQPIVQAHASCHALPKQCHKSDWYLSSQLSRYSFTDDFVAEVNLAAQEAVRKVDGNSASLQEHNHFQPHNNNPVTTATARSESTKALYDKARQATAAKTSPGSSRSRPGMASQRRPWTTQEENALMAGLDQVQGPHWSQILGLYGPGGTINSVLKERNQVQLKDKARNIKLFFLKSGIEVPSYLQQVTGELKTRAPTQAARREAEERARLAGDDERARLNSIEILASGLHSHAGYGSQASSREFSASVASEESPEEFRVEELENEPLSMSVPHFSSDAHLRRAPLGAKNAVPAG